jgi:hypothetical protein
MALVLCICAYHLIGSGLGYNDYRDQHLGTALEFAKNRINLLRPVIVGFNANNEPTPQELPVWQALTAVLFKMFGIWFGWANVASLLFFACGLWPLFQLARNYLGESGAWWALLFYCAQPLVFMMAGQGGTDISCEVFAICFLYFADGLVRTGRWIWWIPALMFGGLAAVTKLPFLFCTGVASFFLLLLHGRKSVRRWLQLGSIGLVTLLVFLIWTRYCNACIARAEFPFTDLRVSKGSGMATWYFGTWSYNLNPWNWIKGGWRLFNAVFGSYVLAALPLWSLISSRDRLGRLWLASAVLTTFVFTHLVLIHIHYYLMFTPPVALLSAQAAMRLEEIFGFRQSQQRGPMLLAIMVFLLAATGQGLVAMNTVLITDPGSARIAGLIREHTQADDKLLIQGGGWGGEQLILSGRKGLTIWDTKFLEDPTALARIKELGYTKLVMVSETPLHHAVQFSKPGQIHIQRDTYDKHLTPVVQDWKVILQNDDLIIKEVPR